MPFALCALVWKSAGEVKTVDAGDWLEKTEQVGTTWRPVYCRADRRGVVHRSGLEKNSNSKMELAYTAVSQSASC